MFRLLVKLENPAVLAFLGEEGGGTLFLHTLWRSCVSARRDWRKKKVTGHREGGGALLPPHVPPPSWESLRAGKKEHVTHPIRLMGCKIVLQNVLFLSSIDQRRGKKGGKGSGAVHK